MVVYFALPAPKARSVIISKPMVNCKEGDYFKVVFCVVFGIIFYYGAI